jgi:hypothetical protein
MVNSEEPLAVSVSSFSELQLRKRRQLINAIVYFERCI